MSDLMLSPARARWAFAVVWSAAVAAAVGLVLSFTSPALPGSEPMTLEDIVDVGAVMLFGLLGAVLVDRRIAEGLGRALIVVGVLESLNYLLGGVADALTQGANPPAAARLCMVTSEAVFIAMFFVWTLAPLLLFPTGRLPSPRWRWVPAVAATGACVAILSVLLAPGPVDEDTPAWGDNPLGWHELAGTVDAMETVGLVLLGVSTLAALGAFAVRWVRYRGVRRRQMAWFTIGVVTQVLGFLVDLGGKSVTAEVLAAVVIFGTMLFGIAWPLLGPLGGAETDVTSRPGTTRTATKPAR